jgi:predicted amidophosphoribosyltransferase
MRDEYRQTCAECGEETSVVSRYCPRCGVRLRDLKPFETEVDQADA